MMKKNDFEHAMVVGARWTTLSISETADLDFPQHMFWSLEV